MTAASFELHISKALESATRLQSNLDSETLAVKGFSTSTMRHFFNNLCAYPVLWYLEVGAYFGASVCAAACNNKQLETFVIENFSQDFSEKGVADALMENLQTVRTKTGPLELIPKDCFEVTPADLQNNKFDVFFFDGKHDEEPQARALPHFLDSMKDVFVFVVDDYNWEPVRKGTAAGLEMLIHTNKIAIWKHWDISGAKKQDDEIFHNGLGIWVITKICP